MTRIYYVRHAEPNYDNHDDALRELSTKGMRDRKLVTDFLKDKKIEIALSSPYKRAFDTIKEFTDSVHLPIEIIEDFRERRVDQGWIEDFTAFAKKQWADFSFKLSDGECLKEVQERNINALFQVLERYKDQTIVIGGHGTALCTILHYFDNSFDYSDFENMKKKMPWIVELDFDDNHNCTNIIYYEHQVFSIYNQKTTETTILTPDAVESCMVPETFHITPISVTKDKLNLTYANGTKQLTIARADIENGAITIESQPFQPKLIRKQGGCKPCTNCGRCSW